MTSVSVRKKPSGKWEVRWREVGGRHRGRTLDRRKDADAFATEVRRRLQLGGLVELQDDSPMTLAEFVEEWWRRHALRQLERSTRQTYKYVWATHGFPELGDVQVRQLTPRVLDDHLTRMAEDGAGAATVIKLHTLLRSVCNLAVRDGLRLDNPMVEVPKPRQRTPQGVAIWPTTVEALRSHLLNPPADAPRRAELTRLRDATLVSVLAYSGLRPGEALALRWADIRDRKIIVDKAIALGEEKGTKTKREPVMDRSVRLLAPLAEDLRAYREALNMPFDRALVFPRRDAAPWRDHDYRNWRKRVYGLARRAAGLARNRPYDLRGSYASLLIFEGQPVTVVARELGHTPATCLRFYARLFEEAPEQPIPAERAIREARDHRNQQQLQTGS